MKNSIVLTLKIMILTVCLVISSGVFSNPMTVYAAENEESTNSQYDISWLGEEGNGAFEKLEEQVKDTGNSAYRLFLAIGVVGLVLSIVICGLSIVVSGGGSKRSEKIGWLLWIGLGGIVIFGAMSLVSVLQSIGGNIV
jgi:hypothetical protein